MRKFLTLACGWALLVVACGGGAVQPTPVGTPAATVGESARNNAFEQAQLAAPANLTFAIDFTNHDSAPHNISFRGATDTRTGEIFSGPGERSYVFAGLPAGTYQFLCEVHPQMVGTLVVS